MTRNDIAQRPKSALSRLKSRISGLVSRISVLPLLLAFPVFPYHHTFSRPERNMAYDHRSTEQYWQDRWSEEGLYRSVVDWDRPNY